MSAAGEAKDRRSRRRAIAHTADAAGWNLQQTQMEAAQ